ncbi:phage holin family protein [Patescibacteria group bacterium]|nr:phage holin family protein [Patescibacteria group bacterium]MBU4367480.1 phage holin family protein [Patescibacteria group bacterium]MBU4462086.1 phage holin family protein [Patescibacteria group bacterium]MCG2700472.1 phage holin family protein [Candidatus Parcubacteria bacterium]
MGKILSQLIAGILGLWLAVIFISEIKIRILPDSNFFGVPLTAQWHIIVFLGLTLGLLNIFLKPVLKMIALPLRIVTLGLFSLVINMVLIWAVDLIFQEITIPWFWPLLWTTLIIWFLSLIIPMLFGRKEKG